MWIACLAETFEFALHIVCISCDTAAVSPNQEGHAVMQVARYNISFPVKF